MSPRHFAVRPASGRPLSPADNGPGTAGPANKMTFAGLFMITLATLMYEILLTRIFSVTMWYHFAFMAISIAMFGMTVGALLVYLFPRFFSAARARLHLTLSALSFGLAILLSFLVHLRFPPGAAGSGMGFSSLALTYTIVSIPFMFSGIGVCLALTKFPGQVGKLYAADLAGAAAGCILLILTLNLTDGLTAVVLVAFLACLGAVLFALDLKSRRLVGLAVLGCFLFLTVAAANSVLAARGTSLFRLTWVKGSREPRALLEKWNSYSRIRIFRDPKSLDKPFGWGLSPTAAGLLPPVDQLGLTIDGSAFTVLTNYGGDLKRVEYLKRDVTNIAHYLRPEAEVLVIGAGGGRDVLSALAFDQRSVVGVEINKDILSAVNGTFGGFTGHLDRNPKVHFVNDEARSYIARSNKAYDLIQSSLIDTWAATAAGAFVLSENSLYTLEGWRVFLEHLKPRGILSFSRWYREDRNVGIYRLAALATTSLRRAGVRNPRDHMAVVRNLAVGTLLVSRDPLSPQDIETLAEVSRRMKFELILSPKEGRDPTLVAITSESDLDRFLARYPKNISPPTDDRPYFFLTIRLADAFRRMGPSRLNAVPVLGFLLIIVTGLTVLAILLPLALTAGRPGLKGSGSLLLFFAAIGFGFMLVEVSQMQRLIIFLGHPTYSLSVVLFTLLVACSFGSFTTNRIRTADLRKSGMARLAGLLLTLAAFGFATPWAVQAFEGAATPVRILVAAVLLAPIGLFMGMAFPLGMRLASARSADFTPWLWGINGAASVWASVAAVVIAMAGGISTSFWVGVACYFVALSMFVLAAARFTSRVS